MRKVLLYSGGMDCWLMEQLWKPDIKLYVDMKTDYAKFEIDRLPDDVIRIELPLKQWEDPKSKIIPLRNLFLIMLGTLYGEHVLLGSTHGDNQIDNSEAFMFFAESLLKLLWLPRPWKKGKNIELEKQFKQYSKKELLKLYLDKGGDIETAFKNTYGCFNPDENGNECWSCSNCARKYIAFDLNGYEFSEDISFKVYNYIKNNMLPPEKTFKNWGEKEGKDILEVYERLRKRFEVK